MGPDNLPNATGLAWFDPKGLKRPSTQMQKQRVGKLPRGCSGGRVGSVRSRAAGAHSRTWVTWAPWGLLGGSRDGGSGSLRSLELALAVTAVSHKQTFSNA